MHGYKVHFYHYPTLIGLYREIWLKQVYKFTPATDKPLIVDCGAHIGMAVLYFKKFYPGSEVRAFEPNPESFELLKKNVKDSKGVELYNYALSDREKRIDIYSAGERASINASIHQLPDQGRSFKAQAKRLSLFMEQQTVELLKIDIEGAEWEVVKELSETECLGQVLNVIVEYHEQPKKNFAQFVKYFENYGFQYKIINEEVAKGKRLSLIAHFYR